MDFVVFINLAMLAAKVQNKILVLGLENALLKLHLLAFLALALQTKRRMHIPCTVVLFAFVLCRACPGALVLKFMDAPMPAVAPAAVIAESLDDNDGPTS